MHWYQPNPLMHKYPILISYLLLTHDWNFPIWISKHSIHSLIGTWI